jgi:DNA primase
MGSAGKGAMDGVRRVLFRLPEVLADRGGVFCEGEEDALNVAAAGLCATTSPQGARVLARRARARFAGKGWVILPDNDDAGRGTRAGRSPWLRSGTGRRA